MDQRQVGLAGLTGKVLLAVNKNRFCATGWALRHYVYRLEGQCQLATPRLKHDKTIQNIQSWRGILPQRRAFFNQKAVCKSQVS